jgi:hypothetical protein
MSLNVTGKGSVVWGLREQRRESVKYRRSSKKGRKDSLKTFAFA